MINNATLVGRLTKDPEMKYTQNGVATTSFTLAVNRTFTSQDGEREADFIPIVTWRKTAENVANFVKKGSLVGVVGRIQVRNYDNNEGRRVYVTEIVAESVQFLDNKNTDNPSGNGSQNQGGGGYNQNRNQGNQGGGYNQNRNQGSPGNQGNRQNQGGYNQGGGYNQNQGGGGYNQNQGGGNNQGNGFQNQNNNYDPFANGGQIDISDDDLPF